jgi:hypothetical protein
MIFITLHDQTYVLASTVETQDLEIISFETFKTIHKFVFKSQYGNPVNATGAAANKGMKGFQRLL